MGLAAGTGSEKWSEEVERDELSTRTLGKGITNREQVCADCCL